MEVDGLTLTQKKIRSFLGMILNYQHFIQDCSAKAKPLFSLLSEWSLNKVHRQCGRMKKQVSVIKLSPEHWTSECQTSLHGLMITP